VKESKQPLFEKSGAKTFVHLARAVDTPAAQSRKSFFAAFFPKKAVLP
jgi:hypothetical protein